MLLNGIPLNYLSRWLGHGRIQTTLVYLELAPDPSGSLASIPLFIPSASDWKTHGRQLRGNIEVGHQKPLVTRLALAVVLDLLVNQRDHHLTGCPTDRLFPKFGERNQKQPRTVKAPRADGYATHRCNTRWRSRSGLARPYPIRLINFTRHICPSHCPVLQGVVSASLIAS